jgi:hypothetical protein
MSKIWYVIPRLVSSMEGDRPHGVTLCSGFSYDITVSCFNGYPSLQKLCGCTDQVTGAQAHLVWGISIGPAPTAPDATPQNFTLPPLPYATDALEPAIDNQTVYIHHFKHQKAYVDNLNTALQPHPELLVCLQPNSIEMPFTACGHRNWLSCTLQSVRCLALRLLNCSCSCRARHYINS